jgi:hypothetical protein
MTIRRDTNAKYPQFTKPGEVITTTLRDFMDNWVPKIAHDEWENRLQRRFEMRKAEGKMTMPRALAMNALGGCLIQPITLWGNPPADISANKPFLSIDGKTRTGAFRMFETGAGFDRQVIDPNEMTFPLGFWVKDIQLGGKTLLQVRAEYPEIAEMWDNIPIQLNVMYFANTTDAVTYFDVANGSAKPLSPGEKFHAITGPRSNIAFETVVSSWAPFFATWKPGKNGDPNYERQQELWVGQVIKLYEDNADDPARGTQTMIEYARREDPVPGSALVCLTQMMQNLMDFQGHCRLTMTKSRASVYAGLLREFERNDVRIYNNPDWWAFIHSTCREILNGSEGRIEHLISRYGENHPFVKASLGKEFLAGKKIAVGMIQEGMMERTDVERHRYNLYIEQSGRCAETGQQLCSPFNGHIDHIVPVSKGGQDEIENLRLVTPRVNLQDGAKSVNI